MGNQEAWAAGLRETRDVQISEDSFRALARSSPWRWTSLHFTRHANAATHDRRVEAWVRRPGVLHLRRDGGRVETERDRLGQGFAVVSAGAGAEPEIVHCWPQDVDPVLRPDGLVAERPAEFAERKGEFRNIRYGDVMHESYLWVAMLDPVELSAGTTVDDLAVEEHHGREVWRATMTAVPGYEPTCGCCAILWSQISDADELEGYPEQMPDPAEYPDAYRVALDVETGVAVEVVAIGGRRDYGLDVEIHAVDGDVVGH